MISVTLLYLLDRIHLFESRMGCWMRTPLPFPFSLSIMAEVLQWIHPERCTVWVDNLFFSGKI